MPWRFHRRGEKWMMSLVLIQFLQVINFKVHSRWWDGLQVPNANCKQVTRKKQKKTDVLDTKKGGCSCLNLMRSTFYG